MCTIRCTTYLLYILLAPEPSLVKYRPKRLWKRRFSLKTRSNLVFRSDGDENISFPAEARSALILARGPKVDEVNRCNAGRSPRPLLLGPPETRRLGESQDGRAGHEALLWGPSSRLLEMGWVGCQPRHDRIRLPLFYKIKTSVRSLRLTVEDRNTGGVYSCGYYLLQLLLSRRFVLQPCSHTLGCVFVGALTFV